MIICLLHWGDRLEQLLNLERLLTSFAQTQLLHQASLADIAVHSDENTELPLLGRLTLDISQPGPICNGWNAAAASDTAHVRRAAEDSSPRDESGSHGLQQGTVRARTRLMGRM